MMGLVRLHNISKSGATPNDDPQPRSDWFQINEIFNADPATNKRAIYLILDSRADIVINNAYLGAENTIYKTSDGATYEVAPSDGSITHIWDDSKAKQCALGYKTRWIMVYNNSRNISCNMRYNDILWAYIGDAHLITIQQDMLTPVNKILKFFSTSENTSANNLNLRNSFNSSESLVSITIPKGVTSIGQNAFYECPALVDIYLPEGVLSFGALALKGCKSLTSIVIPKNVTTIEQAAFGECKSLTSIVIPKNVTTIGSGMLSLCYALQSINIEEGYIIPSNLNISASQCFSLSSFYDFAKKAGDNTGNVTVTIIFGSTNLARFNQTEDGQLAIALLTSKNYTLS